MDNEAGSNEATHIQDAFGNNVPIGDTGKENVSFREAASRALDESEADTGSEPENSESDTPQKVASGEKEPQAKDTSSFDWDKHPEAKKHYDEVQNRYKNLESLVGRKTTEWKSESEKFKGFETKAQQFDRLDALYRSNPEIRSAIDAAYGKQGPKVDPTLEADPLYKFISEENGRLKNMIEPLLQWKAEQERTHEQGKLNSEVDTMAQQGAEEYKNFFGKDASPEDLGKIYNYMAENRVYNGKAAIRALFLDDFVNSKVQAALNDQMAKGTKATKTSSVRSAKAGSKEGKNFRDMASELLDESGFFN